MTKNTVRKKVEKITELIVIYLLTLLLFIGADQGRKKKYYQRPEVKARKKEYRKRKSK